MRKRLILPIVFVLCVFAVGKDQSDSKINEPAKDKDYPGAQTFFPLLKGSVWRYGTFMEGKLIKNGEQVFEVVSLTKTDSGWLADVTKKIPTRDRPVRFQYLCRKHGEVYKRVNMNDPWELYAMLYPMLGDSIPESGNPQTIWRYSSYCTNDEQDCIRLENFDFENAADSVKPYWNGILFQKGIGRISFGGSEHGLDLVEYRIEDDGPIVKYGSADK